MRRFWMLLSILMLLGLCACGATETGPEPAEVPEDSAFGVVLTEPPAAVQTEAPTTEPEEEEATQAPGVLSEGDVEGAAAISPDLTDLAVRAAVCVEYLDGIRYDPLDAYYFWRATACLVGLAGAEDPAVTREEGRLVLPEAALEPYVYALFGPYTEQYPAPGEENPFVAEDYRDGAACDIITPRDLSGLETELRASPGEDGLLLVTLTDHGQPAGEYRVTVKETERGVFIAGLQRDTTG